MAVYVLHFDPPFKHARHYIGYTPRTAEERLRDHLTGRGSPLVLAAHRAGCTVTIAKVWKSGCRNFERWLKIRADVYKWCKHCGFCTRPTATMATWKRMKKRHAKRK